jgi:hypothetical protein
MVESKKMNNLFYFFMFMMCFAGQDAVCMNAAARMHARKKVVLRGISTWCKKHNVTLPPVHKNSVVQRINEDKKETKSPLAGQVVEKQKKSESSDASFFDMWLLSYFYYNWWIGMPPSDPNSFGDNQHKKEQEDSALNDASSSTTGTSEHSPSDDRFDGTGDDSGGNTGGGSFDGGCDGGDGDGD